MTKNVSVLIEAINRVGIQNISLLSRMTGMPTETVRYTMRKRFPNMGLKVRTPLNHSTLGLERYFVSLRLTQTAERSSTTILKELSSRAFLTYWCTAAVERRHLAFFSVPVQLVDEFRSFLDELVKGGVLVDYSCESIEWSRNLELKSRYYDFGKGEWSINWDTIKASDEAPPSPERSDDPTASPHIDATDTLIIKELELDSWRNIAEIARKLRLNERTVRWHYGKHVAGIASSSYVSWVPATRKDFTKAISLIHEFNGLSKQKLARLRLIFNNFPFAWFEGGRKDGYYQVHSALPAGYFMESLRYLNTSLGEVVPSWNAWTIDMSSILGYTLPYENFNDKRGWFFNKEDVLQAVLPRRMKIK